MRRLAVIAAVCVLLGGAGLAGLAWATASPGHAPLHIGCKHHNHGPAWHDGHVRALGLDRRQRGAAPSE